MTYVFVPIARLILWWRGLKQKRWERALTRMDEYWNEELRTLDPAGCKAVGVWVSNDDIVHQRNGETPEARLVRRQHERDAFASMQGWC